MPKKKVVKKRTTKTKKTVKRKATSIGTIKTEVTYKEGTCRDSVKIALIIANEKIKACTITTSKPSCKEVKQAAKKLQHHIKHKHMADAYRITTDLIQEEHEPHHAADLVVHLLRQAILNYESQRATSSLNEVVNMLQEYDKDFPPRDLKYDYEY